MASILKVLTELTSLSSNGITILKPFRSWFGIPLWRGRTVGMRLLNAGEIEQSLEYITNSSVSAQDQALKKEIVARSLWTIDGSYVVAKEDLEQYNQSHKTELSDLEYKRIFVHDFEQYLVDYLYALYSELQQKQARYVVGIKMCGICKRTDTVLPEGSRKLKFSTAEYICGSCLSNVSEEDEFDFEGQEVHVEPKKEDVPLTTPAEQSSSTVKTPADFPTIEDYRDYLINLAETNENETANLQ